MGAVRERIPDGELERAVGEAGRRLARRLPGARQRPLAHAEQRLMAALAEQPQLRAALLRFVDVRPACRDDAEIARHLAELLADGDGLGDAPAPARAAASLARRPASATPVARVASLGVRQLARRFVAGRDAADALDALGGLWRRGVASSVDLLGEATVAEAEADRYAARCDAALRTLGRAAAAWPARPLLERDAAGPVARVDLSLKVSALTPALRAHAPERGIAGAAPRLRGLLRTARALGAHLHVDVESLDTREAVVALTLGLLSEPEFADGPSAGIVLQAYLTDSSRHLDELLAWAAATPRAAPLTIRLVKGAYWDHERAQAAQRGWPSPVFAQRRDTDRAFETLTGRLLDAFPLVRPAIASHNLRSLAHAVAGADARGLRAADVEYQVLRGLGDDVRDALRADGRRVRCYSPVGDLVAGMAYLVRRLLENTANDSFLAARARGRAVEPLLEAP